MTESTQSRVDLRSPHMQSLFKKMQRTSLATNFIMCVVTVLCAAIAIWSAVKMPRRVAVTWAEILFLILLGLIVALGVALVAFGWLTRKPYVRLMHRFVAQGFEEHPALFAGGNASFEVVLVGDKLTVMRAGCDDFAQFDFDPIKNFTGVCASTAGKVKKYIRDYYFLHAAEKGADSVLLEDRIARNPKVRRLVEGGKPVKDCSRSYFVKHGFIK